MAIESDVGKTVEDLKEGLSASRHDLSSALSDIGQKLKTSAPKDVDQYFSQVNKELTNGTDAVINRVKIVGLNHGKVQINVDGKVKDYQPIAHTMVPEAATQKDAKAKKEAELDKLRKEFCPFQTADDTKVTKRMRELLANFPQDKVKHNSDGTTTYTFEEYGLTNRPTPTQNNESIKYYKTELQLTTPAGSLDNLQNLNQCEVKCGTRQYLDKSDYLNSVHEQISSYIASRQGKESKANLYTHGVMTSAESNDETAFQIGLFSGTPVVCVDWNSTDSASANIFTTANNYETDRENGDRYGNDPNFQAAVDDTVQAMGGSLVTNIIGFSHGAQVNAELISNRSLKHQELDQAKDPNAFRYMPYFRSIFDHPDLYTSYFKKSTYTDQEKQKHNSIVTGAGETFVLANPNDVAMIVAPIDDALHFHWTGERLGHDDNKTRNLLDNASEKMHIAMYLPPDSRNGPISHYVNDDDIAALVNDSAKKIDKKRKWVVPPSDSP